MPEAATYPKLYDDFYDPAACMIRLPFESPGYHSRVPSGTLVHPTNPSLCYALDLLYRGDQASDERAVAIMRKVIPLQDQDPLSRTYGIWPWLYEEPLQEMAPPDWNWADFCGFRLAQILLEAGERLPEDLRGAAREALFHAAGCIYRRNVGTHYTNICVMGGIVTTLAGEILGEERMLGYGRRRLRQVVEHHRGEGSFNEYNSPTYTRVVLWDCEQALSCIRDEAARDAVEYLFRAAWEIVAAHFHPATGQWAGPHSRDYTAFLTKEMAHYIAFKTGVNIRGNPAAPLTTKVSPLVGWALETKEMAGAPTREFYSAVHFNPEGPRCPTELADRFRSLPEPEYELRERYLQRATESASIWGTTWMHEEACLGSVNHDFFMDQRRAVLGYWNGGAGQPVALRLRFLHDGREFSSAYVCNAQSGAQVLSAVHLLLGQGDFHPTLDVPANDTFSAEDFRLRYELRGEEIGALENGEEFSLFSGGWEAVITPGEGLFDGVPVKWQVTREDDLVAVDAVCYEGPRRDFRFRELRPVFLAAGLQLRQRGGESDSVPLKIERPADTGTAVTRWGQLSLSVPDHATPLDLANLR